MDIAKLIKHVRERREQTQVQLGKASGIPRVRIGEIERGIGKPPSWSEIALIADALLMPVFKAWVDLDRELRR